MVRRGNGRRRRFPNRTGQGGQPRRMTGRVASATCGCNRLKAATAVVGCCRRSDVRLRMDRSQRWAASATVTGGHGLMKRPDHNGKAAPFSSLPASCTNRTGVGNAWPPRQSDHEDLSEPLPLFSKCCGILDSRSLVTDACSRAGQPGLRATRRRDSLRPWASPLSHSRGLQGVGLLVYA